MTWRDKARAQRAKRALERQLDYQQHKSKTVPGQEHDVVAGMKARSLAIRAKLEQVRPIGESDHVLEVGSGAHGVIFFFGSANSVGVDPLAEHYSALFPAWQSRARTIAAYGENLPFENGSFDVVLSDNVVDHAERPATIIAEMVRVLAPSGLLYFTVNVHHPVYHLAASVHAGWRALGIPFEIRPFADHTVHLTLDAARALFRGLPLRIVSETDRIEEMKRQARLRAPRHMVDRLKRLFYKNALFEVIAVREP